MRGEEQHYRRIVTSHWQVLGMVVDATRVVFFFQIAAAPLGESSVWESMCLIW